MGNRVNTQGDEFTGLEESAEDLYENAPCGYLSTLPNGTIVKINKTLLKWLGFEAEELLQHKRLQELFTIGGRMYYETHFEPLLRMQGFVNEVNFDLKSKQGEKLPVLINTTQVKNKEGKHLLNRTTVFNITDRKKYEQELIRARKVAEEASRVKDEFLSTVSHEIRTPLNAIVSIANLLQEMSHTQEQDEYFTVLKHSSDNLLHLINDILDYSKIEAGRVELTERNLNLRDLVSSLLYGINLKAEEKGLQLKVDIDDRLPAFITGDPVKIGQVLTNLLGNAVKFTDKGFVELKMQLNSQSAKEISIDFCVKDTGIGIPEDKLDKVFEAFTQANYDVNLKYGGTGLGLTISQKLLALYGSKLTVKSREGEGTEFCFNLRLKPGTEDVANTTILAEDGASIAGVRLLLVEDNPVNVMVVSKYLERWGVVFDVAEHGLEAVKKVVQQDYKLVLMDLQMPYMDGYEATTAIRQLADEKYKRLPVIALSASTRYDYKERMKASGINDFVSKPFNANELKTKIAFYSRSLNRGQSFEHPDAFKPLPIVSSTALTAQVFNLDTVNQMLKRKDADLLKLIRMTVQSFEDCKIEFPAILRAGNLDEYKFSAHKIKMTVELFHAERLQAAIAIGRNLLSNKVSDMSSVEDAIQVLNQEFDAVIAGLNDMLKSRTQVAGS